jgi:hypothetical protein
MRAVENLAGYSPSNAAAGSVQGVVQGARDAVQSFGDDPYDPLNTQFEATLEVAGEFHRASGIAIPDEMLRRVSFVALCDSGKPHPYPVDYYVSGSLTSSRRRLASQLYLTVLARKLDWQTYLAVPYVLLHELVSHAFVGPWDPDIRGNDPAYQSFAEGWMDAIALQVHDAALDGAAPLTRKPRFGHATGRKRVARRFHDARFHQGDDDQAYASREIGRDAADKVSKALEVREETSAESPQRSMWRLSAALNTGPLDQLGRHAVATELARKLAPHRRSRGVGVEQALGEWAKEAGAATTNEAAWDAALKLAERVVD